MELEKQIQMEILQNKIKAIKNIKSIKVDSPMLNSIPHSNQPYFLIKEEQIVKT